MDVLFEKVKELKLPMRHYAIFGSGPIAIRGLRECGDIDVVVDEVIWNEYKNKSDWRYAKKFCLGAEYLK